MSTRVIRPSRCFHVASLGRYPRQSGWQLLVARRCRSAPGRPPLPTMGPEWWPLGAGWARPVGRMLRRLRAGGPGLYPGPVLRIARAFRVGSPPHGGTPAPVPHLAVAPWRRPKRDPSRLDPPTTRPSGPGSQGVSRPRSPKGRRGRQNPAVRGGCRCGLWIAGRWPTFIRDIWGQAAAVTRLRA
jgi:hypothetical protein